MAAPSATTLAKRLMAYAEANFENGWDIISETHTIEELADEIRDAGVTNSPAARALFEPLVDHAAEIRSTAF